MADETKTDGPAAGETPAAPAAPSHTAPAAAHAAPKPAAAPRPPAAPLPDLAGKTTTAASAGGAAAKAATAPAAAKPAASSRAADDTSPLLTRRAWMGLAWGAFSAASAAALAATGRFMFPNVLNEPPQQFKAGFPTEYGMGVDERWKEKFGVWIVRTPDDIDQHASGFYALSVTCTHLGCTPNYLSAEAKFKCPCHGSGFRTTGVNFEGPAPAARARARRPGRRRADPHRQEPAFPARARTVDRPGGVSRRPGGTPQLRIEKLRITEQELRTKREAFRESSS
jgi:cytochrome b6-f complex iron-sulfur subunit